MDALKQAHAAKPTPSDNPAANGLHDGNTTPLRFITCGSVDDGKSTLIGRLLWDTKTVPDDQAAASRLSQTGTGTGTSTGQNAQNGIDLPDFANLLDGLQAEREQGITIDVAYRYFSTPRRSFIVADTPGHAQYTRNMATGASTADVALLLVDARAGLLEQTRRHATIVALMGIRDLVLVVNKIDLVDYDQSRFQQIETAFRSFAVDLGFTSITAIPTAAVKGQNVVFPARDVMPWYDEQSVLETLELAPPRAVQSVGFRLPVQRVVRPDESFRGYQGTIAGGAIKPGDAVVVLPSGARANVSQIVTFDLVRNAGVAGDAVTLVLDRPVDIARGDMIVSAGSQPHVNHGFKASLIVLDDAGLDLSRPYILKAASRRQAVRLSCDTTLDLQTGEWVAADELGVNTIARVRLQCDEPAIFDPYAQNRDTGSFILIDPDTNNTIAGGMVDGPASNVVPLAGKEAETATTVLSMPTPVFERLRTSAAYLENEGSIRTLNLAAGEIDSALPGD